MVTKKKRAGKTRIEDVAKLAGVSVATVSRVVITKRRISRLNVSFRIHSVNRVSDCIAPVIWRGIYLTVVSSFWGGSTTRSKYAASASSWMRSK